ncbi:MAG: leucine-rich repeat protein [Muribaculaceae bacterium]|nr:leucine-rich repeat protein [Muribaculaceae bacterium]
MKHIYRHLFTLVLLGFLSFSNLNAKQISPETAKQNASDFVAKPKGNKVKGTTAISTPVSLILAQTVKDSKSTPLFYIFSRGENRGYVIASADTRVKPILAISHKGTFSSVEELPEPVKYLLETYKQEISSVVSQAENNEPSGEEIYREPIEPLVSTIWGQDSPFNNECPIVSGERAPVGCVGLANAMVMRYHEYPMAGTGSSTYTSSGQSITYNYAEHPFDYANMLDYYSNHIDDEETIETHNAVSNLCLAAALACGSNFKAGGTASSITVSPFINTFGYPSDGAGMLSRDYFTIEEWEDIVYEELENKRPVAYGGKNGTMGHAFVIDGYEDGLFHINWGWFGDSDDFYCLTSLRPGESGTGANNDNNYSTNQEIVRGVRPPSKPAASPLFIATEFTYDSENGNFNLIAPLSKSGYKNIRLGVLLCDTLTNEVKEKLEVSGLGDINISDYRESISFKIDLKDLPDGNYRVRPAVKLASSEAESQNFQDWYPVYCYLKFSRFADVEVSGGNIVDSKKGTDANFNVKFTDFELNGPLIVGEITGFQMKASNNGNVFLPTVHKRIYVHGTDSLATRDNGREAIGLEPGQTMTVNMALPVDMKTAGEYDLQIVDVDNPEICYSERIPFTLITTAGNKVIDGIKYLPYDRQGKRAIVLKSTMSEEVTILSEVEFDGEMYTVDMLSIMFANTSTRVKKVNLPPTIRWIGSSAFYMCSNLQEINLPENLEYLGGNAFGKCSSLQHIELPSTLTAIYTNTFTSSGLISITLPSGIKSIGKNAFSSTKLSKLTIPAEVELIEDNAFGNVYLTEIRCYAQEPPVIFYRTFMSDRYNRAKLYVPDTAVDAYKKAENWKYFSQIGGLISEKYFKANNVWYEVTPDYEAIVARPQQGETYSLTSYSIPDVVTYNNVEYKVIAVADSAFMNVSTLTALGGGANVTKVGSHAFDGTSLNSLSLPQNVVEIGDYAYANTKASTITSFPATLQKIGKYAFANNSSLAYRRLLTADFWLDIPSSVKEIGDGAFANCTSLNALRINAPFEIGKNVFENTKGLTTCCLNNSEFSEDLVNALQSQMQSASFYIDASHRDYYSAMFEGKSKLYNLLQELTYEVSDTHSIEGISNIRIKSEDKYGNPRITYFQVVLNYFTTAGYAQVDSYEPFSEEGYFNLVLTPILEANNIQVNLTFEQPGLFLYIPVDVIKAATIISKIELGEETVSLKKGDSHQITARYTPENPSDNTLVWTSSDESVAIVDTAGQVTAISNGNATITCKALRGPASATCLVEVGIELRPGKALDDGTDEITVADVNAIASHIMGDVVENFNAANADANQDGSITISDITTTVKMILNAKNEHEESKSVKAKARAAMEDASVVISFDDINIEPDGSANVIARFIADDDYSSIQADIICPHGLEILDIQLAAGLTTHSLAWKKINDSRYRLIIYSVMNNLLPSNEDELASIKFQALNTQFGKLDIEYGWAATPSATKSSVTSTGGSVSVTTSINDVLADTEIVNVYNTSGVLILQNIRVSELNKQLAPGFYIVVGNEGSHKLLIK